VVTEESPVAATAVVTSPQPVSNAATRSSAAGPAWSSWSAALWIAGAVMMLGWAAVRVLLFHKTLHETGSPPAGLRRRLRRLSNRIGLRHVPALRVVDARISPCVWLGARGTEVLVPRDLLRRLTPGEIDTLLTHELAHVLRRDHWVRWLELVASSLFWWHPVAWWARVRLRRAEEACCDEIVVRATAAPGDYARGLVKTIEFLAGTGRPVPALASGVGEARQMEERLTMIMKEGLPSVPSRTTRWVLALSGLALLSVAPTWSDPPVETGGDPERDDERIETRSAMLELEQRAIDLEEELRRVRREQVLLKRDLRESRVAEQVESMRLEARRMEHADQADEARVLREKIARLEREAELQRMELAAAEEQTQREMELRRRKIEIEQLRLEGDAESATALEDDLRSTKERLERARREAEQAERLLSRERFEMEDRKRAREHASARMKMEMAELYALAARLEQEGRLDEAREVEMRIEDIRREIASEPSSEVD
jgi:beta-lactamase regulating signal transducer with metallopeptidase domain